MQYTFQDWLPDILGRESGNDPNALFGFRNRGGQFGDTRVSEMTLDEVINFTRPSGPYAQSVKNQIGYVATPTGLGLIVGKTMRGMKDEMGLTGSEMYDEDLQLAMAEQIYNRQGKNAWEALHGMSAPSGMAMPTGISGGGANYNPRAKRRMAKDGSNMMQQKQPQGLLGRLTNRSESSGLNMLESFAAGLDPLIMPSMRGGDAIRERGDKRVEQGDKNRTIDFLRANGRNDLAQMVSEGMITPKQAAAQMLTPKQDNSTAAMKNYEFLMSQGVDPEPAQKQAFGGKGTNINLNTGPNEGEFFKKTAGNLAERFGEYGVTGGNAGRNILQLDMLETFLDNSSTGFSSGLAQAIFEAGGPNFQGDDETAAATIINQLIPSQRPAGSGTTSDKDMALYKASLPSIRNSAGGNKLIVKSMRALMQYDIDRAAISDQAMFGDISPQDAMKQINALPDPFASVRQFMGLSAGSGGADPSGEPVDVDQERQRLLQEAQDLLNN